MASISLPRLRLRLAVALFACAVLNVGCDHGPKHYRVAGTVTLDGTPVPDGEIIFFPSEGGPPDCGPIEAGAFAFDCVAGSKRVQITATRAHPTRKVAGFKPGVWVPAPVNYIPERYRGPDSELKIEVPRGGDEQVKFDLKSD